jgi:DsbC/DsbD-like thiol-disulfide interchange protein
MVFLRSFPLATSFAAAAFFCSPAQALESPWTEASHSMTRIIADAADAHTRAGIEVRLERGWKTYWRYPGDAGVPPRFDWSGSENLATTEIRWPAPELLTDETGTKSIGYHDNVVFPVSIVPIDPAKPVKLKLKLDFAVCEKLCVPADAEMTLNVPPETGDLSERLEQAEARVPRRVAMNADGALKIDKIELKRGDKPGAIIEVSAPPDSEPQLFAEGPSEKWALPLPVKIEPANGHARFSLDFTGAPPGVAPIPPKLTLTLVGGSDAIEVEIPLE